MPRPARRPVAPSYGPMQPESRARNVDLSVDQAALIARALRFFADKGMALSEAECEEATILADMAEELSVSDWDPGSTEGWCF